MNEWLNLILQSTLVDEHNIAKYIYCEKRKYDEKLNAYRPPHEKYGNDVCSIPFFFPIVQTDDV